MVERRFTVIPGGAAAEEAADAGSWRIAMSRPGQVAPEAVVAWRALLTRVGAPDAVFADPDYLQAAAQHCAAGREVVFALASTGTGAATTLRAAVALTVPHPLWGRGRFAPWHPRGHTVAPAVEARFANDLQVALAGHLRGLRRNAVLDLGPTAHHRPPGRPTLSAVSGLPRIPARDLIDVGGPNAAVRERIVEPHRIRDAVEEFLVLDAAHAARPILDDPSEASFVRVVTRLFARRQRAAVDLSRRHDHVVDAVLRLGAGPQAVVWRRAFVGMDAAERRGRSA